MSTEKSPGMRALEALDAHVFNHGMQSSGEEQRNICASIIERETGVTELANETNALRAQSQLYEEEFQSLRKQADELAKALEKLLPEIGWRGVHASSNDLFQCEFCKEEHEDYVRLPHTDNCPVTSARAALSAYGEGKS